MNTAWPSTIDLSRSLWRVPGFAPVELTSLAWMIHGEDDLISVETLPLARLGLDAGVVPGQRWRWSQDAPPALMLVH